MSNAPSASPTPTPGSATLSHPAFAAVKARFPDVPMRVTEFRGCSTLIVPPAEAHAVLSFLKDEPTLRFDFLSDITAVDYLGYPVPQRSRFAVVYVLRSTQKDLLLIVKTTLDPSLPTDGTTEDPALYLDSVTDLWTGAEWMEREVFDMFGIRFRNHPDLRRILLWETYPGHPLRKDYPLRGRGEREQFRVIDRTDA